MKLSPELEAELAKLVREVRGPIYRTPTSWMYNVGFSRGMKAELEAFLASRGAEYVCHGTGPSDASVARERRAERTKREPRRKGKA